MRIRNLFCAIFVITAMLVAPTTVQAQDSPVPSDGTYGFGISVTDALFPGQNISQVLGQVGGQQQQVPSISGATVLVPYTTPDYRIEGRLSIGRASSDNFSLTEFGIGGGYYMYAQTSEDALLYYGGRINIDRTSFDVDQLGSSSDTNFLLAPVAGFDYYISDHFSVGAEVEIAYRSLSEGSTIQTGGDVFLRAHF